ncbi:hypothetical protein HYE67_000277 [Fusarium culmorum]|uniref:Uncharacterized protein n=1 Tax=Fusarium culmorum TaxID=5516 RepID=A0A7S8HQX4_FUSCU|nr:hypothetical protein HYE67_000277 [Fusarium culmorum]
MRELRHVIGARAGGDDYDDEEDYGNEIDALPMPTALPTIEATGAELREDAKTVEKLVADVASLETLIEEAVDPASADTKRNILLLEKKRMRLARIKTNGTGLKGSLSIKYGSIGGAGKGSFVDSDKFKESGLNFFISVKVINQSINIKDALVFQGLPSVDQTNFRSVFGDCYIAGFLEGGEFNTLVSMKVVNKAKAMSTKADGPAMDNPIVDGDGCQISRPCGQYTSTYLARPSGILILNSAILTKYESLRSFMALKPPALTPMYYENASIYTNALLDAYMDYKNVSNTINSYLSIQTDQAQHIYRTIGTQLSDIQAGNKRLQAWDAKVTEFTTNDKIDENLYEHPFEATNKGLDLARRSCRFQMIKIVNEVDAVEKNPAIAANEKRPEAYQSTIVFRERMPVVVNKEKLPHLKIFGTEEAPPKLIEATNGDGMQEAEITKANSYLETQPDVGVSMRLAPLVGSPFGDMFCNLDFVKADFSLRTVTVEVEKGVVVAIRVRYANGL